MLAPHFNSMSLKGKIPLASSVLELKYLIGNKHHVMLPTSQFHSKHCFFLSLYSPSPKYTKLFLAPISLRNPAQPSAS